MKIVPADTERVEVDREMPQGMERRLVLRLLGYWRELCGDRTMPARAEIDAAAIPELWPHCFVLGDSGPEDSFVFQAMGDEIAGNTVSALTGKPVTDAPSDSLPGLALVYMDEILEKAVPVSRGGEYVKPDGAKVLYRSVLLPLGDNDGTVDGILGAANCREIVKY